MNNLSSIIPIIKTKFSKKYLKFNHAPTLSSKDYKYLKKCLDTEFISTAGKFVNDFEKKVSNFTSSKYATSTVSGTTALQIALITVGVKENDEVLIPCFSFVATSNSVLYLKAIPNFVDISFDNLGICPNKLEKYLQNIAIIKNNKCFNKKTGRRISSIIIVHPYGIPAYIEEIIKISKKYNLSVIEDAAACLGSFYKNKHLGTFGELGILSFNGNKIISTGGGGMILTNKKNYSEKSKYLTTVAKKNVKYQFIHGELGYNYRMPNLNSALGCSQILSINRLLDNKKKIHKTYKDLFYNETNIKFFTNIDYCNSNHWLNTILIKNSSKKNLLQFLDHFNSNGIAIRPGWNLLPSLVYLKNFPKDDLSNAIKLKYSIINLPSSPNLV